MTRRRYLVAYDVRDPHRLRRCHTELRSFGVRLQYSVFLCDLDAIEKVVMQDALRSVLNLAQDSVVIVDLGLPGRTAERRFEFMGPRPAPPPSAATIV